MPAPERVVAGWVLGAAIVAATVAAFET